MKRYFCISAVAIAAVLIFGYFLTTGGGVRIIDSSSQMHQSTSSHHPIVGSWEFVRLERGSQNQSVLSLLEYSTLERMIVSADGTGVRHNYQVYHRLEAGTGGVLGRFYTVREADDRGNYITEAHPFEWNIPISGRFYLDQTRYRYNFSGNNLTLYRYTLYQRRLFNNRYTFDDTVVVFRRTN